MSMLVWVFSVTSVAVFHHANIPAEMFVNPLILRVITASGSSVDSVLILLNV